MSAGKHRHGVGREVALEALPLPSTGEASLPQCIRSIKRLATGIATVRVEERAAVYAGAIGFLCHIKTDQATLARHDQNSRKTGGEQNLMSCPELNQLPAMSALLQDPRLFQSVLALLRSRPIDDAATSTIHAGDAAISGHSTHQHGLSRLGSLKQNSSMKQLTQNTHRKRALSVSSNDHISNEGLGVPPAKAARLQSVSPPGGGSGPGSRQPPTASKLTGAMLSGSEKTQLLSPKEEFNSAVYAAVVFYCCFRHLDHWPVSLVQAYSEDCFGPRNWVDDFRCELFVKNLSTVHDGTNEGGVATMGEDDIACFIKLEDYLLGRAPTAVISAQDSGATEMEESDAPFRRLGKSPNPEKKKSDEGSSSDSDSGDEECLVEVGNKSNNPLVKKPATEEKKSGDDSSSSGEESVAEEIVVSQQTQVNAKKSLSVVRKPRGKLDDGDIVRSPENHGPRAKFLERQGQKGGLAWKQRHLNISQTRCRYFGRNLELAQKAMGHSLSIRLDPKVKQQNYKLLSILPGFNRVPKIRRIVAENLEKWMQSPALSGLARALLASVSSNIAKSDPPLADDVKVLESLLGMKLKSNQFAAHVENIAAIAKRMQVSAVSRQIMLHLLRSEQTRSLDDDPNKQRTLSDSLRMFTAVHAALPRRHAAESLASTIMVLSRETEGRDESTGAESSEERILRTVLLVRRLARVLGSAYDGLGLVRSLLRSESRDLTSDEDVMLICRLVFECITLVAPVTPHTSLRHVHKSPKVGTETSAAPGTDSSLSVPDLSDEAAAQLTQTMLAARKIILEWCLRTLSKTPFARGAGDVKSEEKRGEIVGAGAPIYDSALDGTTKPEDLQCDRTQSPFFLRTVRCLLFLVEPDSQELFTFLNLGDAQPEKAKVRSVDESHRIRLCCFYGTDLDDEMMWIILKSTGLCNAGVAPLTSLALIELLMLYCTGSNRQTLHLSDPEVVWKIYDLVVYKPDGSSAIGLSEKNQDAVNGADSKKRKASDADGIESHDRVNGMEIPKLAYPGMWWRATAVVLAICGASPSKVGETMWKEHPTVRALMKMTIASRYRFPTADCDEQEREQMKLAEAQMREKESKVAERLFASPSDRAKLKKRRLEPVVVPETSRSRVSARQREKQAKILAMQREQERARAHAEMQRVKKMLRSAQKTIMVWDHRSAARKPPKESVDLILSVDEKIGIAKNLRACANPDFLLRTIGHTSRGHIERAYDWLIPIISSQPDIISRLPASASCFLLLRAYGGEGDERDVLLELSAPLLRHVQECLMGEFGEAAALRAAEILLVDFADKAAEKRRCARKVLQDAVGISNTDAAENPADAGWLGSLKSVRHASSLVPHAIRHVSQALAYEHGAVLRSLVVALYEYIEFARSNGIEGSWNFPAILCGLFTARPHICSESLTRFPDLRELSRLTIRGELESYLDQETLEDASDRTLVTMKIPAVTKGEVHSSVAEKRELIIPLQLLSASIILVSNWQEDSGEQKTSTTKTVLKLADYLMPSVEAPDEDIGATGAVFLHDRARRAVSIEQWVMLAKSNNDKIARRAAKSAPSVFLPRLLLCCGLARSSFLCMINRLGERGSRSEDTGKFYTSLISPSATVDWGLGHFGSRRSVACRLLGRVSAYFRREDKDWKVRESEDEEVSLAFVTWLTNEYKAPDRQKRPRSKKGGGFGSKSKNAVPAFLHSTAKVEMLSDRITRRDQTGEMSFPAPPSDSLDLEMITVGQDDHDEPEVEDNSLDALFRQGRFDLVDASLEETSLARCTSAKPCLTPSTQATALDTVSFSRQMLLSFQETDNPPTGMTRLLIKWLPRLTSLRGSEDLWNRLFVDTRAGASTSNSTMASLLRRCGKLWSDHHVRDCSTWLLNNIEALREQKSVSSNLVLRFLFSTSEAFKVHAQSFTLVGNVESPPVWRGSIDRLRAFCSLALEVMRRESGVEDLRRVSRRNSLPMWFDALLTVGSLGRQQLEVVTTSIVGILGEDDVDEGLVSSVLLRLYVYFPSTMRLNNARVRNALMKASQKHAQDWSHWRCPLGPQLEEMLFNLSQNPGQRLMQPLLEISKKHPLLVLRYLKFLLASLEDDGAVARGEATLEKKGRVDGLAGSSPALADSDGRAWKVSVRHWGCSFTESVWLAVLDLVLSLPAEVLFSCGKHMGLIDLICCYMKLIAVQRDLSRHENTMRIRTKLSTLLTAFRTTDPSEWANFAETKIEGLRKLGSIKDLTSKLEIET